MLIEGGGMAYLDEYKRGHVDAAKYLNLTEEERSSSLGLLLQKHLGDCRRCRMKLEKERESRKQHPLAPFRLMEMAD